ncbi:MAG: signal recognition particle-docking protein FtsY [Candidatus Stygibacter frigidus]|nr:signal recognition particle-docking protein FtsY [Candidatus Stygibacter frigidus]
MQEYLLYIIIALVVVVGLIIWLILNKRNRKEEVISTGKIDKKEKTKQVSLQQKLTKTKSGFLGQIAELLKLSGKVDEELLEELEEALIKADVGVTTSCDIIDKLRDKIKEDKITDTQIIQSTLIKIIKDMMLSDYAGKQPGIFVNDTKPFVILFTGVNGVGKTTTIGKLAKRYVDAGKSVLMVAADTFRAAAIDQLAIWAERAGAEISRQDQGSDPSSVVFDGLKKALSRKIDIVLIDTAGRQHTKINLMNELNKIDRTIKKVIPDAPHESLLVVDATTGQNALTQAEIFDKATNLSGIVLTKLDGTAKGGIVIGIKHQLDVPVKLIGVGETNADLRDFSADEFLRAIFD